MFPGMGGRGMNPRKMQGMMKQLGIEMDDVPDAEQVIIKTPGGDIIIDSPSVSIMRAQGVDTYQISGKVSKMPREIVIPNEDIELVCAQTGVSADKAAEALKNAKGDLAEAILALSE